MKAHNWMALLLVTVASFALACEPRERSNYATGNEATRTSEQEVAGADQPGDLNPVEAQTMIDDVTIGHEVGADGMIAAEDQGDDFPPGHPIYLTMKVEDTPANSEVKVVWYGPGEVKLKEEQKTVNEGDRMLTFQAANTASWQKGDYRAEIWVGDEKVNQQQFNITDQDEAGR